MHPAFRQLRIPFLLVLCIGVFSNRLNAEAADEPDEETLAKKHLVYVEPDNISRTAVDGEYHLIPYLERRHKWGWLVSVGYSSYEPLNYEPNFAPPSVSYRNVYSSPNLPMLELRFAYKRNFPLGSFGAELTVGGFRNEHSDPNFVGSNLTLFAAHVGAIYSMDALTKEPYFVPYIAGGGYVMFYDEGYNGQGLHGNTSVAPYMNGGIAINLDWIDRVGARIAYEQSGIEASYLYVEAQRYFQSTAKKDPDFSNDVNFAVGIRVEM
jgi:hypothetical protein